MIIMIIIILYIIITEFFFYQASTNLSANITKLNLNVNFIHFFKPLQLRSINNIRTVREINTKLTQVYKIKHRLQGLKLNNLRKIFNGTTFYEPSTFTLSQLIQTQK